MSTTCPVCTTDAGQLYLHEPTDQTCEQLCSKINNMMIMKQDYHFYAPQAARQTPIHTLQDDLS